MSDQANTLERSDAPPVQADASDVRMLVDALSELREATAPTLWVTDAEIIRRLGAGRDVTRQAIQALDDNPTNGFPRKEKLWGDRRYWPAVKDWLDARYRPRMGTSIKSRGRP